MALPVGLNLEAIQWWTPTGVWADLAHQLGTSGAATTPWNNAAVDSNGWPTGTSGTTTLRSGTANSTGHPAGGHALSFTSSAATGVSCTVTNCNPTTISLTRSGGGPYTYSGVANYLGTGDIVFSYSGSPGGIQGLSFLLPGHTASDLVWSEFAWRARRFQALRFYQAMGEEGYGVNLHQDKFWGDRRLPSYATWAAYGAENTATSKGIPYEAMIMVCNKLGMDCWVNVPYRTLGDSDSTDDYCTQLARLFRYGSDGVTPYTSTQASPVYPPLDANLNVYVEFGNELWNGAYPYSRDKGWNDSAASAAGITSQARIGRIVYRLSTIWRTVWNGYNSRVRVVAPSQNNNAGWTVPILDEIVAQGGTPLNQYIYGIAVAPYFNNGGATVDAVIANMVNEATNTSQDTCAQGVVTDNNICVARGIRMCAYEGGIGNLSVTDLAVGRAVQTDVRTRTDVLTPFLLNRWFGAPSGDLFMYYTMVKPWQTGQNGFFGLSEKVTDNTNPKWDSILEVRQSGSPTHTVLAFAGGTVALVKTTKTTSGTAGGQVQAVALSVTTPTEGLDVALPFQASGTATPGATVTCYNASTGAAIASALADGSGNWAMTISWMG